MPLTTMATSVGTSLLTRLIGSGIQRLGSLTFQKIVRIGKIEATLKGAIPKNSRIQAAISDFETVIGTRQGELNISLANFLHELERSGLINSMVENALIGKDSNSIKNVFISLYKKIVSDDEGAAERLFDTMTKSFSVTVEEISKDKDILWPAPGSEDTELGVLMELEVGHGETEVYPRVQA